MTTTDKVVNKCNKICENLDKIIEQDKKFVSDSQEIIKKMKDMNIQFKLKTFEAAEKVIINAIDEELSPKFVKQLVHSQIKYLYETNFGE